MQPPPPLLQSRQPDEMEEDDSPSLVTWWVRITSPWRDDPRRSKNAWREDVASLIFLLVFLDLACFSPQFIHNSVDLLIIVLLFFVDIFALILKRSGYMTLSGIILMVTTEFGLYASILSFGGQFDSVNLPLYDHLIQVSLISMAFFSAPTVFVIVFLNIIFLIGTLLLLPHGANLTLHLQDFWRVVVTPFSLQIIAATLAYVIISVLIKTVRRADKAEKLAALESQVLEQQRQDMELKNQLDQGIKEVLATLNDAANGNFAVRAPVRQGNALWRVGYALNNLLTRLQGFKNEKAELEKTRHVAAQLAAMLKTGQKLKLDSWTGTCLDPLIAQLKSPKLPSQQPGNLPKKRSLDNKKNQGFPHGS